MGLSKIMLTLRTQSPDAGRGADAGRKDPKMVGAGHGKGAIRMDMEDRSWVALLVMWGWALSYFLWLVLKKKK